MKTLTVIGLIFLGWVATLAAPVTTVDIQDLFELQFSPTDALHGIPFEVVEGANSPVTDRGYLTDARNANSPILDKTIVPKDKATAINYTWELGAVPAAGRKLKEIKVWWSIKDLHGSGIDLKFAVRDTATRAWKDITPDIREANTYEGDINVFKVLTVTFPEGTAAAAVSGFNALRMITRKPGESATYTTRFVKVNAFMY